MANFQKMESGRLNAPTGVMAPEGKKDNSLHPSSYISYIVDPVIGTKKGRDKFLNFDNGGMLGLATILTFVMLICHIGLWVTGFFFEADVHNADTPDANGKLYEELSYASYALFIAAFVALCLSQAVAMVYRYNRYEQPVGSIYPSWLAVIYGGLTASAVFSAMYYIVAIQDTTYASHHGNGTKTFATADEDDDDLVKVRRALLRGITVKLLTVSLVKINANFMKNDVKDS